MIKINRLEIENVKKIKATKIIPANSGLTVIGGKNGQGKTSVLDAIAWALGGERYRPSQSQRAESVLPQRWVNNRIIFKSVPRFEDYDARRCNIDA